LHRWRGGRFDVCTGFLCGQLRAIFLPDSIPLGSRCGGRSPEMKMNDIQF
jgi:hypothetical protein